MKKGGFPKSTSGILSSPVLWAENSQQSPDVVKVTALPVPLPPHFIGSASFLPCLPAFLLSLTPGVSVFSSGVRIHSSNLFCARLCCESESHSVMSDSLQLHGLNSPRNSPGHNTEVGSLSLLQRIFPTQGLNPGLPPCRRILYRLSHQGSPRIPGWVAYPFFSGSSQLRNQTGVSCIAGGFFTN